MKNIKTAALLAGVALLASCGGNTNGSCEPQGSGSQASSEVAVKYQLLSPGKMTYQNNRPTYNYYVTTFTQEFLTIFEDNTYALTVSIVSFSAVILPETGNDATANERTNSLVTYYGTCTYEFDEFVDTDLVIQLSASTGMSGNVDDKGYFDTFHWTERMKENTKVEEKKLNEETMQLEPTGNYTYFNTGAEFTAKYGLEAIEAHGSIYDDSLEFVAVKGIGGYAG